jgi:hypothetical protein
MGWSTRGRQFATVEGFALQLCRLAISEDEVVAKKTDELPGPLKRGLIDEENTAPAWR